MGSGTHMTLETAPVPPSNPSAHRVINPTSRHLAGAVAATPAHRWKQPTTGTTANTVEDKFGCRSDVEASLGRRQVSVPSGRRMVTFRASTRSHRYLNNFCPAVRWSSC